MNKDKKTLDKISKKVAEIIKLISTLSPEIRHIQQTGDDELEMDVELSGFFQSLDTAYRMVDKK